MVTTQGQVIAINPRFTSLNNLPLSPAIPAAEAAQLRGWRRHQQCGHRGRLHTQPARHTLRYQDRPRSTHLAGARKLSDAVLPRISNHVESSTPRALAQIMHGHLHADVFIRACEVASDLQFAEYSARAQHLEGEKCSYQYRIALQEW